MQTAAIINTGLLSITIILIGFIYKSNAARIEGIEKKSNWLARTVNNVKTKEDCEDNRNHQTKINIELIDRLARIETKMDLILNNRGT